MPLNDRDYMKPSPPPRRRARISGGYGDFLLNPVYVIIIINFVIFIAALILIAKGYRNEFIGNLGLSWGTFTEKPWTILTSMFLHEEFWHIFGNMITLFFFGRAIYQLVGAGRFLLVYFVGGILGNLIFLLMNTSPVGTNLLGMPIYQGAIGASGAIYAIAGALVVMMPTLRVAIWGVLPLPLWVVILLFFVLWSLPNVIPGVAWQAHLGGLAAGLIAGYFFRRRMRFIYYR